MIQTISIPASRDVRLALDTPSYGSSQAVTAMPQNEPTVIACMGPTGSGKSSFMSIVGGIVATVGHDLESCTQGVQVASTKVDNKDVTLIDTPGFDDTKNSDTEILRLIATYLEASYKAGFKLSGIIYFHRITDNRVGGVNAKNMRLFKSLCGKDALANVILCTTMWDVVDRIEPGLGERREKGLREKFWPEMIRNGSIVVRHNNTQQSARDIVRRLIGSDPVVLGLQDQLVNQGRSLDETDAGRIVNEEILRLQEIHAKEMENLKREMLQASGEELEALKAEFSAEADKLRESQQAQSRLAEERASEVDALRAEMERKTSEKVDEIARLRAEMARIDKDRLDELARVRAGLAATHETLAAMRSAAAEPRIIEPHYHHESSGGCIIS